MSQQPPSQFSNQPSFNEPMQREQIYGEQPKKENTLGMTGFIVSLVGLFLCGVPSLRGCDHWTDWLGSISGRFLYGLSMGPHDTKCLYRVKWDA